MVDRIASLPNGNPEKQKLGKQFQAQICEAKKRHIWCCEDGKPKPEPGKILTDY